MMKSFYLLYLLIFCVVDAINQDNWQKFEKYAKCMWNHGISSWKIADPISNATAYNFLNFQYNKLYDQVFPIAIFTPTSVYDVQATVKCGYRARIQLVPNSGGHSYAGLSAGTNDSIVVDFRSMKSIVINENEKSVTVGPGAFVGHINAKLWENGGWGTPLGICSTVAIGGHGLGGGYGFYSGLYGLTIDNMLEIKMVDAQGNAVTVTPTQNSDLWWALRGAGPGYIGLVTSYKLRMFRAKDVTITYARVVHKSKYFQNVVGSFVKWLDWVQNNNESVTTIITGLNDNRMPHLDGFMSNGVDVNLFHIEDPKTHPTSSDAMLKALPKYFSNATKTVVLKMSYIGSSIVTSYSPVTKKEPLRHLKNQTWATIVQKQLEFFSSLTKDMAISRYSLDRSFFIDKKVRTEELNDIQKVFDKIPRLCDVWITSERGRIADPLPTDCAYVHRNVLFNLRYHCDGFDHKDFARSRKWMDEFASVIKFMDNGQTYQNCPERDMKDYLRRYYGKNLIKLIKIKTKWDPNSYFNTEQSIPTVATLRKRLAKMQRI